MPCRGSNAWPVLSPGARSAASLEDQRRRPLRNRRSAHRLQLPLGIETRPLRLQIRGMAAVFQLSQPRCGRWLPTVPVMNCRPPGAANEGGFLQVDPFLCLGFCRVSQRLEIERWPDFGNSLMAWDMRTGWLAIDPLSPGPNWRIRSPTVPTFARGSVPRSRCGSIACRRVAIKRSSRMQISWPVSIQSVTVRALGIAGRVPPIERTFYRHRACDRLEMP